MKSEGFARCKGAAPSPLASNGGDDRLAGWGPPEPAARAVRAVRPRPATMEWRGADDTGFLGAISSSDNWNPPVGPLIPAERTQLAFNSFVTARG